MRPQPWSPKPVPTLWMDYVTGHGVTDTGNRVKATPGDRRQNPNLADKLNLAATLGVSRIMFTGEVPKSEGGKRHWLLVKTPMWIPGKHWLGAWQSVTGRFEHAQTQQKLDVKIAAEWFGDLDLTPDEARQAWAITAQALQRADEKATMFLSPTATGANLWALSLPRNVDPVHVEEDIAAELRSTSGQHHVEHLVEGPDLINHDDVLPLVKPTQYLNNFAYVDGRFMYAAVCNELGIGPARRLNRAGAFELLESQPYARARYHVRFTVPQGWNHIGILPVKAPGSASRWIYPNRPGAMHETWADSAEIFVALKHGWLIEPIEAIEFTNVTLGKKANGEIGEVKTRPLDTFAERMIRTRELVVNHPEIPDTVRGAVASALRAIVLQTIGGFHSPGRASTVVVESALDVPPQYQDTLQQHGDVFSYKIPTPSINDRTRQFYHPEFSTQIWGRARARLLSAPAANKHKAGVLTLDPSTVLGVFGDAVYTTEIPAWSLPTEQGGGDDGKVGRLRLQGALVDGNYKFPVTIDQRDRLRARAEKAGLSKVGGTL